MRPNHSTTDLLTVKDQLSVCLIIWTPPSGCPKDFGAAHCIWAGAERQRATGSSRSQLPALVTVGSLKPQSRKALGGHRRAPMNVSVPLAERGDVQAWQGGNVNGMARPFQVFDSE